MSLKRFMLLAALCPMLLPAAGCGSSHKPGVMQGVDEEPPPQTQEEIDVERKNQRSR